MDLLISVNSVCGVTDGAPRELRRAGLGGVGRPPPPLPPPRHPQHMPAQPCHWFTAHTATHSQTQEWTPTTCSSCPSKSQALNRELAPQCTGCFSGMLFIQSRVYFKGNAVKHRTMIPTGRYVHNRKRSMSRLYIVTLLISRTFRVHHEKRWAG